MTAQVINFNKKAETNVRGSFGKELYTAPHWSEEYEPEDRITLQQDFFSDLTGQTLVCECKDCHTRDDAWTFDEGCPSCGGSDRLEYFDENTAEDFVRKWPISWGWVFGANLNKPIGCLGIMPWGRFDTVNSTLTYNAGNNDYVTVALPPNNETIVDLNAFGMKVFEIAQVQNA